MEMTEAKGKSLRERRFECQRCGICCSHRGRIQPGEKNIRDLAKYFKISELSFAMRYLEEIYSPDFDAYMVVFKTNYPPDPSGGCIFHFGTLCAIYDSGRADLCNLFPWNHFNLEKEEWEESFVDNRGKFWCPGIGKGREWSIEEIREVKEKYTDVGFGFRRQKGFETVKVGSDVKIRELEAQMALLRTKLAKANASNKPK